MILTGGEGIEKGSLPEMSGRLNGKKVLITQSETFMGPALTAAFAKEGASVLADDGDLTGEGAADALVEQAGEIDVLIANLAAVNPRVPTVDVDDATFEGLFRAMVMPLHGLVRAVLPQMTERQTGKIVVMGSASPMRGQPRAAAYAAARGAQLGYVKSVAVEVARHNVQINAIAQNFVDNPVYFPKDYQETDAFKARLKDVPARRLGTPEEDAMLAVFLASDECNFLIGQAIPFAGGWVQ